MDELARRAIVAHGDAWEAEGRFREPFGGGFALIAGARLMSSGIPHAQWNNGDVDDVARLELEAARTWYGDRGLPWGLRVPAGTPMASGRFLFTKRLMALEPHTYRPAEHPTGVSFRLAGQADVARIVEIDSAGFGDPAGLVARWVAPRVGSSIHQVGLAVLARAVVGIATVTLVRAGRAGFSAYVSGVTVVPSARRCGIGTALSGWVVAQALERGAELVHLHPDDDPAARIYHRLGFEPAGELDVYVEL